MYNDDFPKKKLHIHESQKETFIEFVDIGYAAEFSIF